MLFTPDGKQLLVAATDGTIKIFNPETAKEEELTSDKLSVVDGDEKKVEKLRIQNMIITDDG